MRFDDYVWYYPWNCSLHKYIVLSIFVSLHETQLCRNIADKEILSNKYDHGIIISFADKMELHQTSFRNPSQNKQTTERNFYSNVSWQQTPPLRFHGSGTTNRSHLEVMIDVVLGEGLITDPAPQISWFRDDKQITHGGNNLWCHPAAHKDYSVRYSHILFPTKCFCKFCWKLILWNFRGSEQIT